MTVWTPVTPTHGAWQARSVLPDFWRAVGPDGKPVNPPTHAHVALPPRR